MSLTTTLKRVFAPGPARPRPPATDGIITYRLGDRELLRYVFAIVEYPIVEGSIAAAWSKSYAEFRRRYPRVDPLDGVTVTFDKK